MDFYFIITHAGTKENAENFINRTRLDIRRKFPEDSRIFDLSKNIYPVELIKDKNYESFGLKEVFSSLYNKYKNDKCDQTITSSNIKEISSIFLGDIKTKDNLKIKLTALSQRVKANFKILASTLENSPSVKGTTNLSTAMIKVISKIYDHPIITKECLDYIAKRGFTDEYHQTDTIGRTIGKFIDSIFYVNGPAAKEVEDLACSLIKDYNKELDDDKKFYGFLNNYKNSINYAIDSLEKIHD